MYNKRSIKSRYQSRRRQLPNAAEILWHRLRCKQIAGAKFRRQYSVACRILDFYCPELNLAIAVDNLASAEAQNHGQQQQHIDEQNIQYLRFTNRDIHQGIDDVLEIIYQKVLAIQV